MRIRPSVSCLRAPLSPFMLFQTRCVTDLTPKNPTKEPRMDNDFFYWMRQYNAFIQKFPRKTTGNIRRYLRDLESSGTACPTKKEFRTQMCHIAEYGHPSATIAQPKETSLPKRDLSVPPCLLQIQQKSTADRVALTFTIREKENMGMAFWMAHLREVVRLFPDFLVNFEKGTCQGEIRDYMEILSENNQFCPSEDEFQREFSSILHKGHGSCRCDCPICAKHNAKRKTSGYQPVRYT